MTDSERETEPTSRVNRRTLLKGTAAAGMAGSALTGTASAHPNTIVFQSAGDVQFVYEFRVTGEVDRRGDTEGNDQIFDGRVKGRVGDRLTDSYTFSGKLVKLDLKGPGKVFVNGKLVRDTTKKPAKKLPNKVTIRSKDGKVHYRFRVGGRVALTRDSGTPTDKVVGGNKVRGSIGSRVNGTDSVDTYRFSGPIAFTRADGPLSVKLDLNRLDP